MAQKKITRFSLLVLLALQLPSISQTEMGVKKNTYLAELGTCGIIPWKKSIETIGDSYGFPTYDRVDYSKTFLNPKFNLGWQHAITRKNEDFVSKSLRFVTLIGISHTTRIYDIAYSMDYSPVTGPGPLDLLHTTLKTTNGLATLRLEYSKIRSTGKVFCLSAGLELLKTLQWTGIVSSTYADPKIQYTTIDKNSLFKNNQIVYQKKYQRYTPDVYQFQVRIKRGKHYKNGKEFGGFFEIALPFYIEKRLKYEGSIRTVYLQMGAYYSL